MVLPREPRPSEGTRLPARGCGRPLVRSRSEGSAGPWPSPRKQKAAGKSLLARSRPPGAGTLPGEAADLGRGRRRRRVGVGGSHSARLYPACLACVVTTGCVQRTPALAQNGPGLELCSFVSVPDPWACLLSLSPSLAHL